MRGPIELLRAAWNSYKENWKLFLGVFFIPGILISVVDSLDADAFRENEHGLVLLALFVILIPVFILMNVAMYKAVVSPKEVTVKSAYQFALSNFVPYFVVSILVGVIVILGLFALIVPGVIFGIWFSFAYFALLEEGKKGTEALKASREYVRGHWWEVLGRILVLVFALLGLSIVLELFSTVLQMLLVPTPLIVILTAFIMSAISVPLGVAYSYLMYQDLKRIKNDSGGASTETPIVEAASM